MIKNLELIYPNTNQIKKTNTNEHDKRKNIT